MYGIGKGGKTTLLTHAAAAIVAGIPFLEREVLHGPVLWLDLEQHWTLTAQNFERARAFGHAHAVHIYNGPAPKLPDVRATVRAIGAVAVVVDSLSKLLAFQDENDAAEVTRKVTRVLDIARETNAAFIAIHHDRKREGDQGRAMRGSSAFLAATDMAIALKAVGGDQDRSRRLECVSRYPDAITTLCARLTDDGYVAEGEREPASTDRVLDALGDETLTALELATRLGITRQATARRLKPLVAAGKLIQQRDGTKGKAHAFSRPKNGETATTPRGGSGSEAENVVV